MILLAGIKLLASSSDKMGSATSLISRNITQSYASDLSGSIISTCSSQRSIYDIMWSCFATIFACCWVSIHPNMPSLSEPGWRISLRRIELLVWGLVAPELVILWAMRQWYGARCLADRYKGHGWTKMHGHFLQMGGFRLVNSDRKEELGVLTADRFDRLLKLSKIDFPSISEKEIQDRSKGDSLSKGLVAMQSTWFIVQCVTRFAQGLVITEIELVTLALATLNGVMYFLWWDKPLDARFPVSIYMKIPYDADADEPHRYSDIISRANDVSSESYTEDYNVPLPLQAPSLLSPPETAAYHRSQKSCPSPSTYHIPRRPLYAQPSFSEVLVIPANASTDEQNKGSNRSPMSADTTTVFPELPLEIHDGAASPPPYTLYVSETAFESHNHSGGISTTYIGGQTTIKNGTTKLKSTLKHVSQNIGSTLVNCCAYFLNLPVGGALKLLHRLKELGNHHNINSEVMKGCPTIHTQVPTFYSTTVPTGTQVLAAQVLLRNLTNVVAAAVGALFGAIHCAGWNFQFLSRPERILWRMSSILITSGPSFVAFCYLITSIFIWVRIWPSICGISWISIIRIGKGHASVAIVINLYIIARLCLLTLALISLRDLSAGAYAVVEWAQFIPHI